MITLSFTEGLLQLTLQRLSKTCKIFIAISSISFTREVKHAAKRT